MSQEPQESRVNQEATQSRNVTQVGGNNTNTVNVNIWLTLIGVLVLGGLAWALVIGLNQGGQMPNSGQKQFSHEGTSETSKPSKPKI